MNDREYSYLKEKIRTLLNIEIDAYKGQQMRRRLDAFVARQEVNNPYLFCKRLERDHEALRALKDMLTINVSEFFRDGPQFEHLRKVILPGLLEGRSHLNIWAAGCSHGAEPYSLAMLLDDLSGSGNHRILATDVDGKILQLAKAGGPYPAKEVRNVTKRHLQKHFLSSPEGYTVVDEIRSQVQFREQNLLSDKFESGFDLILCRNVMIYFSEEAKTKLFRRFEASLKPGGVLFLGGTEAMLAADAAGFQRLSTNFYRKLGAPSARARSAEAA